MLQLSMQLVLYTHSSSNTVANLHGVCFFINPACSRTGQYGYDVKRRLPACDHKLFAVIPC